MEVNKTQQSESVRPIEFLDIPVNDFTLRQIEKGNDIILQLNADRKSIPAHAGAMMVKALMDGFGKAIMDSVTVEMMDPKIIEGGSVYVRMRGLNTATVRNTIKTSLLSSLLESTREA